MKPGKKSAIPRVRSLALALQAAWGITAFALPDGAAVVNGQVQITQPAAGVMRVNTSNGAIINWRQFSIGAGESTQFVQPSSSSAVLNRVLGRESSALLGQLTSNGQVFLINPNGITIGAAARIDTNSFIASTLDLADADFLAGKLRFAAQPGAGTIRNEGLISAGPGGRIALIAPDIENSGIIHAPDGNILLAAGRKLEIASLDMDGIRFEIQAPTDSVLNLGKLLAENGAVRVFAGSIRHSGEAIANRLAVDADGSIVLSGRNNVTLTADSITRADGASGGTVLVQSAEGTTRVQGLVSAAGTAGSGGDIRILGERVALDSNARIVASGSSGGGQILVGGDYQGANAGVQNAARVFVGGGVRLEADATDDGDGGRVIVWADENTRFAGSLSARGGPNGGDGGFAEVSGKQNLEFTGAADLGAAHGASGTLLLDPLDILVSLNSGILPIVVDEFADFSGNVVTISPLTLAAVGGNVVLQAERDIYVRDAITLTTGGAGLSMTAGGVLFDAGSIFNTAGITTNGGAVTLRAQSVSGPGTITTAGGAVDVLTTGTLNYSSAIASGGGAVTLASNSSVFNANVDAGSGAILVNGTSISSGSYLTTGTAAFTASAGNIFLNSLNANVASLTATSSINATISAGQRIDAASTGSSVSLRSSADAPLRLGTVSGNSGVFLTSSTGMEQVGDGVITARTTVRLDTLNSSTAAGSAAAPIRIASPSDQVQPALELHNIASSTHVALNGGLTLGFLDLRGTVAGLAGVVLTGAANLPTLTLTDGGGALNLSAVSTGGLASGFRVNVTDGQLNAALLTLPGAPVALTAAGAAGAVTVGTMTGGSLDVQARGAVNIGSATTTGSFGIRISTGACNNSFATACATSSPIVADTLNAGGTGNVNLRNRDNGDISVTSLTAARDVEVDVGNFYTTSFNFPQTSQRTTNRILLGTVVAGDDVELVNRGSGEVNVTSLAATGDVLVEAGGSFTPVAFGGSQLTNNTITIGNTEPMDANQSFRVNNDGIGDVTLNGSVNRGLSGDINLYAEQGSISALGNLSARYGIDIESRTGSVALGQLASGVLGADGDISVNAFGDLSFHSVSSTGSVQFDGDVFLRSNTGSVTTTQDNAANDISATGNVTIQAGMAIGDGMAARPMDIRAGASRSVSLTAGTHIGAAMAPVNVDTSGSILITSTAGQFHLAATDGVLEKSLSTINLSASAAGIGTGNQSTFTSLDLDVTADSNGSVITIGDLVRSAGTLNSFQFSATGTSGLVFGDVNLTTAGLNQFVLNATNGLTQTSPLTNGITAGTANLTGGAGAVEFGAVMARSLRVSGAGLSTQAITTTGTSRSNFNATPDTLTMSSTAGILVTGALSSATVIDVNSGGGDLTVTGAVTGIGASRSFSNAAADRVQLQASGNIATGGAVTSLTSTRVIAGGSVTVGGAGIDGGTSAPGGSDLSDTVTVTAGTANAVTTQAITDGFSKTITGGTLNITGGVSGAAGSTVINGTTFNTGNLATSGALTINATGAYAPNAIALSATGSVTIDAPDGIDLQSGQSTLTAPTVSMTTMAGNIAAALTNTTNLTINTGGRFNVGSSAVLSNLTVTADGTFAGAGAGSVVDAGGGAQLLTYVTTGSALALGLESSASNSYRYTESSASILDIAITSTGTFSPSGGTVNVSAPLANITIPSLMLGSASLVLSTDGDITLTSLASAGGAVNVSSGAGTVNLTSVSTSGGSVTARTTGDDTRHVNVQGVTTLGGNVTLRADNGSIVGVGAASINSLNGQGLASGTTNLRADNGAIGSAGTPINTAGAVSLVLRARDAIEVDVTGAPLTNLTITTQASGNDLVDVSGSGINFTGLSIQRSGSDLLLNGLNPVTAGAFSLTAVDGNIVVGADIANVTDLTLNAGNGFNSTGDLRIQAGTGPRSVVAGSYELRAGQDVLITAGATASDTVSVSQTSPFVNSTVTAGRDILLTADGGSAALSQGISTATQIVSAGRDLRVSGGSIAGASAAITSSGAQSLTAANDLVVRAGAADGASARIVATQSQNFGNVTNLSVLGGGDNADAQLSGSSQSLEQLFGTVTVQGGTGEDAFAQMVATTGSQSLGSTLSFITTDQVLVQGGAGADAYASIRAAASSQELLSSQDIRVFGGAGAGAYAELAGTSQSIGSTTTFNNQNTFDPTANILVQAGSGGIARILAGGTQTILAGEGISVLGGSGTNMSATIETTGGGQTIGNSSTFRNEPTKNILLRGGTGAGSIAGIQATGGSQTISTGGTISVLGHSGVGALAEIRSSTGDQTIGSTSINSNRATESILVQAGAGGIARILAQGSQRTQTIMTGGDLFVEGGPSAAMTASIEATNGFQSIGNTSTGFNNNPSGSILVQAGTGDGSAAFIKAATGQTIDAGGTIAVRGSGANAYAEIATDAGTQTIGNVSGGRDRTDAISLAAGTAAGSYARIATAGFQTLSTSSDLSLTGATGINSGALLLAGTGQNLTVQGSLAMLGGSASAPGLNETAIRNNTSGTQSINVSGNMSVTGGGFGSDTWVKQNGSGNQSINVSGNLALLAPASTPATGVTSIEALGPNQNLFVGGALSIVNQAGWLTYITSAGTQTIDADTIAISLSTASPVSNPFAGLSATGNQTIRLQGDGTTVGSATLSIVNTSGLAGSLAGIQTAADQVILMDYDTAGLIQIGSTAGLGETKISAGGDLTMVAGQLLLQGGATASSNARLLSGDQPPAALTGTMLISTLYGPVQLQGSAGGGAFIDPLLLSVVSNGSVLLQAGANAGSDANINAGTFDLAATLGDVSLINSTTSSAIASITAGTFNLFGSGNVNLNGGTITVTQAGTITINGICFSCDTNLFGPFTVSAFIPPPLDFGAMVTGSILALADLGIGLFDAFLDDDDNLVLSNRRLNQCY